MFQALTAGPGSQLGPEPGGTRGLERVGRGERLLAPLITQLSTVSVVVLSLPTCYFLSLLSFPCRDQGTHSVVLLGTLDCVACVGRGQRQCLMNIHAMNND